MHVGGALTPPYLPLRMRMFDTSVWPTLGPSTRCRRDAREAPSLEHGVARQGRTGAVSFPYFSIGPSGLCSDSSWRKASTTLFRPPWTNVPYHDSPLHSIASHHQCLAPRLHIGAHCAPTSSGSSFHVGRKRRSHLIQTSVTEHLLDERTDASSSLVVTIAAGGTTRRRTMVRT